MSAITLHSIGVIHSPHTVAEETPVAPIWFARDRPLGRSLCFQSSCAAGFSTTSPNFRDGDGVAAIRIVFAPVGALQQRDLPVDEQLSALDFHLAKTNFDRYHLSRCARTVSLGNGERAKVRIFSRPEFRRCHVLFQGQRD
jgi:hypothetical protein